jgi:hypothetical protein
MNPLQSSQRLSDLLQMGAGSTPGTDLMQQAKDQADKLKKKKPGDAPDPLATTPLGGTSLSSMLGF